jgi:hypothetical protein
VAVKSIVYIILVFTTGKAIALKGKSQTTTMYGWLISPLITPSQWKCLQVKYITDTRFTVTQTTITGSSFIIFKDSTISSYQPSWNALKLPLKEEVTNAYYLEILVEILPHEINDYSTLIDEIVFSETACISHDNEYGNSARYFYLSFLIVCYI